MKLKRFFIVLFVIFLLFAGVLVHHGVFSKIEFSEKSSDKYVLVYSKMKGDFAKSGIEMDKIYKVLKDNKINSTQGFGFYFDDPKKVKKEDLRYISGCIIDKKDKENFLKVNKEYIVKDFESQKCLYTEFPFLSKLSIVIGIFKVYPNLNKYVTEKKYKANAIMEVYDIPNKKIKYLMPLNEKADFVEMYYK